MGVGLVYLRNVALVDYGSVIIIMGEGGREGQQLDWGGTHGKKQACRSLAVGGNSGDLGPCPYS